MFLCPECWMEVDDAGEVPSHRQRVVKMVNGRRTEQASNTQCPGGGAKAILMSVDDRFRYTGSDQRKVNSPFSA